MGTYYKYKCKGCDFEREYCVGGGVLTEDYFIETKKLEEKLKLEALNGKYGDIIRAMVEADTEGTLFFSCGTVLFQCNDCKEIIVTREKNIVCYWSSDMQYDIKIEIKQRCPKCGCKNFKRIERFEPMCPKCKKEYLELVSFGKWD